MDDADDDSAAARERASAPTMPADRDARPQAIGEGSVLADRYRLIRRIGGGGMGSVWEAEHLALGSRIAVKLIHRSQVDDARARERFLREARAAATLRSPNVVQIFDHGVHDDTPYIAMELLEGEPLSARLRSRVRLEPDEVIALMTQIGRAAARAHASGIVHRDLKPDNIYLVPSDHGDVVKVLDFGIAKHAAENLGGTTTGVGAVLGTPFYMSPEQLVDAATTDLRADLWSMAVIAYECLVGERPFSAHSIPEIAVAVLAGPRVVPSEHAQLGEVSAGFDAWFERATRRDPELRYRSATELVDALSIALGGSQPLTTNSIIAPRERPRRRGLLVATVVGAATLAGLAIASSQQRATPHETTAATPEPSAPVDAPAAPARPVIDTPPQARPTTTNPAVVGDAAGKANADTTPLAPDEGTRKRNNKPVRKNPRDVPTPVHDTAELEP